MIWWSNWTSMITDFGQADGWIECLMILSDDSSEHYYVVAGFDSGIAVLRSGQNVSLFDRRVVRLAQHMPDS